MVSDVCSTPFVAVVVSGVYFDLPRLWLAAFASNPFAVAVVSGFWQFQLPLSQTAALSITLVNSLACKLT